MYDPEDNEKMVKAFEVFLEHGDPADKDREQLRSVVEHERMHPRQSAPPTRQQSVEGKKRKKKSPKKKK